MSRFRDIETLQKAAAVHASIHNRFNHDRQLNRRDIFKQNRSAALAEWRDRVPARGVRALRSTRLPAGRAGTFRLPRWAA